MFPKKLAWLNKLLNSINIRKINCLIMYIKLDNLIQITHQRCISLASID